MSESLNAKQIQAVRGLYTISSSFRDQFSKLVELEISKAHALVSQLEEFKTSEEAPEVVKPVGKKRGRPVGSKNVNPGKPKKEKVVMPPAATPSEPVELTQADVIRSVLTPEGLSAGEVYKAISKVKNYKAPSLHTLYTVLSNMHKKNLIGRVGESPNCKYVVA